jgi:hypothetical protein
VSTRSPVFKGRPLPASKKEAIDMTFGFDKSAYEKLR